MRTNVAADLWNKVAIGELDACWPWLGAVRPNGYGVISVDGRNHSTHRLAFRLAVGPIPDGHLICHTCDNPPCCNPAHLYAGTSSQNQRDAVARERRPSRKGSLHPSAKLTENGVLEIRRRRAAGDRAMELASEFGVSRPTITRVVKAEGWVHV